MKRTLPFALLGLAAAAAAVACSGSSDADAEAAAPAVSSSSSGLTFHKDVEPILQKRCQSCHHAGGIGPFSLLEYEDAAPRAAAIAGEVKARTMPPWGADDTDECKPAHAMRGDPRLSQAEIDTIVAWASGGTARGDAAARPKPVTFAEDALAGATDTLTPAMPYTVVEGGSDEFVCVVFDPKVTQTTWVNGIAIQPTNALVAHHALLFTDPTRDSLKKADANGRYPCFGGPGVSGATLLTAWAPGVPPADFGTRVALELPANTLLVMQMHYHPHAGGNETDATKVVMRRAPAAPEFIANTRLIGNSDSASGIIRLLPGPNDPATGPAFFIPANASGHTETMEFTLPKTKDYDGVRVAAVGSHMHWVGRDMKVELTHKDSGQTECLLQTPRYDFNWQRGYAYDAEVESLPRASQGDTLRIRCTYQNDMGNLGVRRALEEKHLPGPIDVTLGEETLDEMCLGAFTLLRPNPTFGK